MSFTEDLSVFFDLAGFADEVLVEATNRKFPAIFDETYFDPEAGETFLEGAKPLLTCKSSDLGDDVVKLAKLTVKGKRYSVLSVQPEGTGTVGIVLSKLV